MIAPRYPLCLSALCLVACLDPLASDSPGYSPRVLAADAAVPRPGTELSRAIDAEDGVDGASVPRRSGFLGGERVEYWELGAAPGVMRAAYQLYECTKGSPDAPSKHPIVLSAVPGDADYSPFLALQPVCVSDAYRGERLTSTRALRDATDIGLVGEPLDPRTWLDAPIVGEGTTLEGARKRAEDLYYDGFSLRSLRPLAPGPFTSRFVRASRVYEIFRSEDAEPAQVVFEDAQTPLWTIVRVDVSDDADLASLRSARDLFEVAEDGALTPASDHVTGHEETGERVHRTLVAEVAP